MFDLAPKYIFGYINELNDEKIFVEMFSRAINLGIIQRTNKSNVLIFNSKNQEFIVIGKEIILDEELVINLTNLILRQLKLAKIIPTKLSLEKGNYRERNEGNIKAIVNNLVFHKWYYHQDNISVLDMAADFMYRIAAINHPFTNGNKRTALLSAGAFLDSVGLYLSFDRLQTKTDYLDQWENFMIDIAKSREFEQTEDEVLSKIKNKLFESIEMNFNENMIWTKKRTETIFEEVHHEEFEL